MAELESIKRKIRALLAKKNGGSEAEISSALALAKKLMGDWRLTEADVADQPKDRREEIVEAQLKPRASPPAWEMEIGIICQELFQVKAFTRQDFDNKMKLCFVGFKGDVELAMEMFTVLKSQILPLCTAYSKAGASYGERCRFGRGIVQRVIKRVRDAAMAAQKEDEEKCRALVISRNQLVEQHVREKLNLRAKRNTTKADEHFAQGWKRGEQVDLGLGKKKLEANS